MWLLWKRHTVVVLLRAGTVGSRAGFVRDDIVSIQMFTSAFTIQVKPFVLLTSNSSSRFQKVGTLHKPGEILQEALNCYTSKAFDTTLNKSINGTGLLQLYHIVITLQRQTTGPKYVEVPWLGGVGEASCVHEWHSRPENGTNKGVTEPRDVQIAWETFHAHIRAYSASNTV